jgi:hypothetical protein
VVETMLATLRQEVIAISKKFGFPVALKIVSRAASGQRATADVWMSSEICNLLPEGLLT